MSAPRLEDRSYDELLADALARIPVHTPEWTTFHHADPGVTLLELFAFLTESVAYRANLLPERQRARMLELLGVPRAPGTPARGLVTLSLPRGGDPVVLAEGLEARAGQVPFRLTGGVEVLPVEARAVVRRRLEDPSPQVVEVHRRLYAALGRGAPPEGLVLYETVPLPAALDETVDGSVWLALLVPEGARATTPDEARALLERRTLSVGVVAEPAEATGAVAPAGTQRPAPGAAAGFRAWLPRDGAVVVRDGLPELDWTEQPVVAVGDVLHVRLPGRAGLAAPRGADPVEDGVGSLPPVLADEAQRERLVTWLRLDAPAGSTARLTWAGINAAAVEQRARVGGEAAGTGTGEPDQAVRLARTPVVPGSVVVRVGGVTWTEVADLLDAAGEVAADPASRPATAFACDVVTGEVRFGDGRHGARPPAGAAIVVDYDHAMGAAGDVPAGAISAAPALPPGVRITNPVRTAGGADAESVADGERHAARFLQHRDRLVTVEDAVALAHRAPGADVARAEALPCYDPRLGPMPPGDAAGALTVLVVPRHDPAHPETPEPAQAFLDAVCAHLAPRRLATTELFVRGPEYVGLWVTVGYKPEAGRAPADVEAAITARLRRLLRACDPARRFGDGAAGRNGWPLGTAVERLGLVAEVARTAGVELVTGVRLAVGDGGDAERVPLAGLQLPRLLGLSLAPGEPPELDAVRGLGGGSGPAGPPAMPVPVMPEDC